MHIKNRHAQSILEYTLIIMLVGAAIVVGGPVAFNAYRAAVKTQTTLLDERGPDVDALTKAPGGVIQVPGCTCGGWQNIGCRANDTCRNYRRNCTGSCPPVEIQCFPDTSCCTNLIPVVNPPDGCGPPRCAVGQIYSWQMCGDDVQRQYSCLPSSACVFQCGNNYPGGRPPPPGAAVCPSDNINLPTWTIPWRLNAGHNPNGPPSCSAPPELVKCESYCPAGLRRNNAGTACEACPVAQTISVARCRCKANAGENETQNWVRCTEGPYTNFSCDALGSPVVCGENNTLHHWVPYTTTANCPSGTTADSGFCGSLDYNYGIGGCGAEMIVSQGPTGGSTGWACTMTVYNQDGGTCHSVGTETVAFCTPPAECPQPVLVDFQIKTRVGTTPAGNCNAGWRELGVGPDIHRGPNPTYYDNLQEVRYCALIQDFSPTANCPNYAQVLSDIFLIGDHNVNLYAAGNATPVRRRGSRAASYGAYPCPSPNTPGVNNYWQELVWNGRYLYKFCKKVTPPATRFHCGNHYGCTNTRTVMFDLRARWNNTVNPPACSGLPGAGWIEVGLEPASNIRWCKRMTIICVQ